MLHLFQILKSISDFEFLYFRKALVQARAPAGLIQETFDVKLNPNIQTQLKKIKIQVRNTCKEVIKRNEIFI